MKRRDFVKTAIAAGVLPAFSILSASCRQFQPKKILVLGGTFFAGPAIVTQGLKNGHHITLFNRGITNPGLFPDLPLIKGDRTKGQSCYEALTRQHWDAVIDVWPEQSVLVDEATQALKEHTAHYVFISSIAVYADFQEVGLHEASKKVSLDAIKDDWGYSEEKLHAENLVRERFPSGHTILRPGPIKGYRDPALDLLYWLVKLRQQKEVLGPGSGMDPLQFVDARDIGRFAFKAIQEKLTGSYNLTGPLTHSLLWKDFLDLARQHLGSDAQIYWPDESFLWDHGVSSWTDMPLWAPLSEDRGFMQISNKKTLTTGFELTPVKETIDDCLSWFDENYPDEHDFASGDEPLGIPFWREQEIISRWKNM